MPVTATTFDLQPDDEDRLIELLNKIHELRSRLPDPEAPICQTTAAGEKRQLSDLERQIVELEAEVLEIVDGYFRASLRGIMTKLFGPEMASRNQYQEATLRFTELLNNFFVKMLEKRPDAFWRARKAKDLRKWASVANANLMRDALRRDRCGRELLKQLTPLVDERKLHFQKTAKIELTEDVLKMFELWRDGVDPQMGLVLTYRYLDGMSYAEIANQLDIDEVEVKSLRSRGIQQLRERFDQGER